MERTLALIESAHKGDKKARDTLFEENVGLVWSIVKRFYGRGVEAEDLFQIGSIGLLKAMDHFDTSYEVKFSTYAVPMITGEIKRFLRDDGMLKVSRSLKEISAKAYGVRQELEKENGKEPDVETLASAIGVEKEDLVLALEASTEIESLQKTVYQGESHDISLMDKIPEKKNEQEKLLEHLFLEEVLGKLKGEERKFIFQRFFQEQTQTEIAKELGVSQVQVSRMEKKILKQIRSML